MRGALQLRLGEQSFLIEVADGELTLSRGSGEADVTISTDPPTLAGVLTGQLSLEQAEAGGAATLEGSRRTARRLLRLFPMPEAHTAPEVAEAAWIGGAGWPLARPGHRRDTAVAGRIRGRPR